MTLLDTGRAIVYLRRSTPCHVTKNVVQNTRPSFSDVRGGSGHETTVMPLSGLGGETASYFFE